MTRGKVPVSPSKLRGRCQIDGREHAQTNQTTEHDRTSHQRVPASEHPRGPTADHSECRRRQRVPSRADSTDSQYWRRAEANGWSRAKLQRGVAGMQASVQPSAAMAVTEQQRRARALAMLRTLHGESERVRAGRRRIQWCSIDVIVKQPADVDVLAYAVDQGWIAIAPNGQTSS